MQLTEKIVAIVVFTQQKKDIEAVTAARACGQFVPVPRLLHYQVTLDPTQISPSGAMIRLGDVQGDEILGWQRLDSLEIVEVLVRWNGDVKVTLPRGAAEDQS